MYTNTQKGRKEADTSLLANSIKRESNLVKQQLDILRKTKKPNILGSVKTERKGNNYYYTLQYFDTETQKYKCKYIRRENTNIAKEIVLRDYISSLEERLLHKKEMLEMLDIDNLNSEVDACFSKLDNGRKNLISPLEGTIQYRLNAWYSEQYEPNMSYPEQLQHKTERGERVRSKSEEFIANYLYSQRRFLDYKYERPLTLMVDGAMVTLHPDFTIINLLTAEIFYLEHVGRLDMEGYVDKFVWKHNAFVNNGLIQEGRVLYSMESANEVFSLDSVKRMVKEIVLA